MKKLFLFAIITLNIFAIERNFGIGDYIQQGLYKGQKTKNYPFFILNYGPYYINGSETGFNFEKEKYTISPILKYDTVKEVKASELDNIYINIDDRKSPFLVGGKIKRKYKILDVSLGLFRDFTSNSNIIYLEGSKSFRPFKPLFIIPSLELRYYDDKYCDYFYGVSYEESIRTGLTEENIKGGISWQASLKLMMFFSEKAGLYLDGSYEKLDSSWKSSILEKSYQSKLSLVGIYRF